MNLENETPSKKEKASKKDKNDNKQKNIKKEKTLDKTKKKGATKKIGAPPVQKVVLPIDKIIEKKLKKPPKLIKDCKENTHSEELYSFISKLIKHASNSK